MVGGWGLFRKNCVVLKPMDLLTYGVLVRRIRKCGFVEASLSIACMTSCRHACAGVSERKHKPAHWQWVDETGCGDITLDSDYWRRFARASRMFAS